jgi:hypothetical protein
MLKGSRSRQGRHTMYDEELSDRLRDALEGMVGVGEKRMMGGLCFMLNGNMLGGAHREKSGEQLFMFRVGKEREGAALSRPGARPMKLGDRSPMRGFVFVDASLCNESQLKGWVSMALAYISTLPPK